MARIPTFTNPNELAQLDRPTAQEIAKSRGQLGIVWGTILQSPEVAGRLAHLGTYIRFDSRVPDADRELAMIVAAANWNCQVELAGHSKAALSCGVSQAAVDAVVEHGPIDRLPGNEKRVIQFAREIVETHRISEASFAEALTIYGPRAVVDLIATVGYMCCVASLINGLEIGH